VKIRPDSWLVCGPFRCHRRPLLWTVDERSSVCC